MQIAKAKMQIAKDYEGKMDNYGFWPSTLRKVKFFEPSCGANVEM